MIWVVLALLAPLLFAGSNFVDKYALSSYFEKHSIATYVAATGIVGLPFLVFFSGFASEEIMAITRERAVLAFAGGLCLSIGIAIYLKALSKADASLVVSLLQMIIILNYIFGLIFLDEKLGLSSLLLIATFIFGAVLLAIEQDENGIKFRKDILGLMLGASVLISLSDLLFKLSAINGGDYASSQFFEYAATVGLGLTILLFSKKARRGLKDLVSNHAKVILWLLLLNEVLTLSATIMMRLSSLHMPLAVLQALLSIQSVYLVVLGVILTKMWPQKIHENIGRRNLIGKLTAIGIMMAAEIGLILTTV